MALATLASAQPAAAQTATWTPAGVNAYLSNGANWDTGSFPNSGTAIFGASTETHPTMSIAFGGSTGFLVDGFTFLAGAPAYTFDVVPITGAANPITSAFAVFDGAGIVNQSAFAPTFNVSASLVFTGTADAGNAIINNNGAVNFAGFATGGNTRVINQAGGAVDFSDSSTHSASTALGSIEGAGALRLGDRSIAVGALNLSTTFSGTIADGGANGGTGGSLTKTGTGTLTLTGTNTYTGGTTISAGTLAAGHVDGNGAFDTFGTGSVRLTGGTLLATVTGNLKNNISVTGGGTIAAATGTTLTLGGSVASGNQGTIIIAATTVQFGTATDTGVIELGRSQNFFVSGTPSVVVAGGTLRSVQNNDLSDLTSIAVSTTVNAGATLDFNDSSQQIITNLTGAGHVVSGSTPSATSSNDLKLVIGGGNTNVFSGTISGARGVSIIANGSTGTQVLSGANTYTGNTSIFQTATLQIGNGGASGSIAAVSNVFNGGTLAFNRSDAFTFANLIADDPNQPGIHGKVTQIGTGTTILTAANTYTGATTVNAGTLAVNGSIASASGVTVNNGGTLAGTGTVSATTVTSGGTLAAGNGTAGSSLNVAGSLALQSGAFYLVQINPATASFANVSGAASLGGSTVKAIYANGSYLAKQYTILTAGSVSGTFASVAETNLPSNVRSTLSYDATHAYLNLILNFVPPQGTGLGGNQGAVGNAITGFFNSNGGIPLVYSGLTAGGLSQASGETATGSQQTTFQAMTQFMGLLTDPFSTGRETGASAPPAYADSGPASSARDAYAMLAKAPIAKTYDPRWSEWAAGFGGSQTTDGNTAQGSNSATSRLFGAAAGAEYLFSAQTLAGFALAGGGTSFSVTGGGTGRSDLFQAGAYFRHSNGPSYISAALAYGWQDVTTDRTVTLAGVDHLRAEFNANAWSGRLEGGYRLVAPWVGLTPYAAGQFTTFNLPAYAETVVSGGGAFALAYGAKSVTDPRSEFGLRTDKSFAIPNGVLTLRGRAAWAHDFDPDRAVGATFQALPGASFVVNGARAAADSALTTVSAEMKWLSGWSVSTTFEGEFSNVTRSYAGKGALRYQW